jgi:hypothetical protein
VTENSDITPGGGSSRIRSLLSFPDPVNEVSARLVAAGVVVLAVVTIAADTRWLLIPLAYGFLARTLSGPTLSPWGQVVTRLITPRLPIPARPVPGPPKRFAQGIGLVFSLSALILAYGGGSNTAAYAVLGALALAASLEAFAGFCLGCRAFALLMRVGLIPESVCERCANIYLRA